eukprot:2764173-Pyramimonas_sp.AAC.1
MWRAPNQTPAAETIAARIEVSSGRAAYHGFELSSGRAAYHGFVCLTETRAAAVPVLPQASRVHARGGAARRPLHREHVGAGDGAGGGAAAGGEKAE